MRRRMRTRKNRFIAGTGLALFLFLLCPDTSFFVQAQESVFEKEADVYLIQSAQDMRTLALLVNGNKEVEPGTPANIASYRLTRDIDLSAYCKGKEGWEPIGYRDLGDESLEDILWEKDEETGERRETDAGYFNGTFDGDSHVITGLYINRPEECGQGLFGHRTDLMHEEPDSEEYRRREHTVIRNLYIKDCDITGETAGGVMGGMICWGFEDNGSVRMENCHVTGKVSGGCVGGVVVCAATVKNSSFAGTVRARRAGGIAESAYAISGCAVHAVVQGSDAAGGLSDVVWCVQNSYMTGTVQGDDCAGGIAGRGIYMSGCYSLAHVTGFSGRGGLAGRLESHPEVIGVMPEELVAVMPEDFLSTVTVKNCLMGRPSDFTHLEETDFRKLLGKPEEGKWADVWFCATDYAYPNLSWERESRFGYTVTVTAQEGDSLWKIAEGICGDGHFWPQIYAENQDRVGDEADGLLPGTDLEITLNASLAAYVAEGEPWRQEKEFLEKGREQGLSAARLQSFYRRLLADDLWNGIMLKWQRKDYGRRINTCVIADLDGNGQKDMLVMAGEGGGMVPGVIWLYYNEEPVSVLKDENAYYEDDFCFGFGLWNAPWMADLDNDGNQELLFEVFNGGNGGSGGRDICLFRHVGSEWKDCLKELPNDRGDGGDVGLRVSVTCAGVDRYEAHCPYLDESIEFDGENIREIGEDEFGHAGGSNVWGFYCLECVAYKGKNALQCREYLSGEGGNAHGVGDAVFILVWDVDGVCRVADWRVEGYTD